MVVDRVQGRRVRPPGHRVPGATTACTALIALAAGIAGCRADGDPPPDAPPLPWDSLEAAVPAGRLVLGLTTPFEKVFAEPPEGFTGTTDGEAEIRLARNERESVQLVLLPFDSLASVTVEASDPAREDGRSGAGIPALEIRVIGEVNLVTPRTERGRAGWHPDPLFPNRPLELEPRVPRPLLVTVHADSSTVPGRYRSDLTVRAGGAALATATLSIHVWDLSLPRTPRFRSATLADWELVTRMWPPEQGYAPPDDAERMRRMLELATLGFENRLPPTVNLASGLRSWNWRGDGGTDYGFPTHDRTPDGRRVFNPARTDSLIDFMLARGASHFFLGTTGNVYRPSSEADGRRDRLVRYLSEYASHLRSRGLLDRALVYGVDEPWGDEVADARRTYALVKERVGRDLRFMQNTNQNTPRAIGRFLGAFDVLDINLGFHDAVELARYRLHLPEALAEVWWNVNLWPDSRPNLLLDDPLVDARMIGPLSWAFGIEGFEYWQMLSASSMERYHPVGPEELRVAWDVNRRSLDGTLVYPGRDTTLHSSLRLEALRDGFEDYELLALLEAVDPAHALLAVPTVRGLDDYDERPERLLAFRTLVAEAILSSDDRGQDVVDDSHVVERRSEDHHHVPDSVVVRQTLGAEEDRADREGQPARGQQRDAAGPDDRHDLADHQDAQPPHDEVDEDRRAREPEPEPELEGDPGRRQSPDRGHGLPARIALQPEHGERRVGAGDQHVHGAVVEDPPASLPDLAAQAVVDRRGGVGEHQRQTVDRGAHQRPGRAEPRPHVDEDEERDDAAQQPHAAGQAVGHLVLSRNVRQRAHRTLTPTTGLAKSIADPLRRPFSQVRVPPWSPLVPASPRARNIPETRGRGPPSPRAASWRGRRHGTPRGRSP